MILLYIVKLYAATVTDGYAVTHFRLRGYGVHPELAVSQLRGAVKGRVPVKLAAQQNSLVRDLAPRRAKGQKTALSKATGNGRV
jgi:hypothetical protein